MNLQTIQSLKSNMVQALLAAAAPMMVEHPTLRDGNGAPVRVWAQRDAHGYTSPLAFEDGYLQPVHLVSAEGVYQNKYGNAVLLRWEKVCIEDVARILAVVEEANRGLQQALLAGQPSCMVVDLDVLDRLHTIVKARLEERSPKGDTRRVQVLYRAPRATCLLPTRGERVAGTLDEFVAQLRPQCQEFELTELTA